MVLSVPAPHTITESIFAKKLIHSKTVCNTAYSFISQSAEIMTRPGEYLMTDSCSFPSVDSDTTSLVSRSTTSHLLVTAGWRKTFCFTHFLHNSEAFFMWSRCRTSFIIRKCVFPVLNCAFYTIIFSSFLSSFLVHRPLCATLPSCAETNWNHWSIRAETSAQSILLSETHRAITTAGKWEYVECRRVVDIACWNHGLFRPQLCLVFPFFNCDLCRSWSLYIIKLTINFSIWCHCGH